MLCRAGDMTDVTNGKETQARVHMRTHARPVGRDRIMPSGLSGLGKHSVAMGV